MNNVLTIGVDAGGLGQSDSGRFGTNVFSENVIRALLSTSSRFAYNLYTQRSIPLSYPTNADYKVLEFAPRFGWMQSHVLLHELISPSHVFLALNQAFPLMHRAPIIGFSHGLSFIQYPHLYPDYDRLKGQLDALISHASVIFVTSQRVREELLAYSAKPRVEVLPVGIPYDMTQLHNVAQKKSERKKAFLFVGMNHSIKQVEKLVQSFAMVKATPRAREWELWLVGDHDGAQQPGVKIFKDVSREQLRTLYASASVYVCASLYESLHFPYLEALSQNTPIIGLQQNMIEEIQPFAHACAADMDELSHIMQAVTKPKSLPVVDQSALLNTFSWAKSVRTILQCIE